MNISSDDKFLSISIQDNGREMSVEQMSSVGALVQFERNAYEQQGVGLGLSIAKKLVELHDGIFEIKSEVAKGTEICFKLPIIYKA